VTQRLTSFCMIALVLACPYACLLKASCGESQCAKKSPACCQHCEQNNHPQGADENSPAENSCDGWCFCKSAVPGYASTDLRSGDVETLFPLSLTPTTTQCSANATLSTKTPDQLGGSHLRIVIGSLLC